MNTNCPIVPILTSGCVIPTPPPCSPCHQTTSWCPPNPCNVPIVLLTQRPPEPSPTLGNVITPAPRSNLVTPSFGGNVITPTSGGNVITPVPGGNVIASAPRDSVIAPPPGGHVIAPAPGSSVIAPPPGSNIITAPPKNNIMTPVPLKTLPSLHPHVSNHFSLIAPAAESRAQSAPPRRLSLPYANVIHEQQNAATPGKAQTEQKDFYSLVNTTGQSLSKQQNKFNATEISFRAKELLNRPQQPLIEVPPVETLLKNLGVTDERQAGELRNAYQKYLVAAQNLNVIYKGIEENKNQMMDLRKNKWKEDTQQREALQNLIDACTEKEKKVEEAIRDFKEIKADLEKGIREVLKRTPANEVQKTEQKQTNNLDSLSLYGKNIIMYPIDRYRMRNPNYLYHECDRNELEEECARQTEREFQNWEMAAEALEHVCDRWKQNAQEIENLRANTNWKVEEQNRKLMEVLVDDCLKVWHDLCERFTKYKTTGLKYIEQWNKIMKKIEEKNVPKTPQKPHVSQKQAHNDTAELSRQGRSFLAKKHDPLQFSPRSSPVRLNLSGFEDYKKNALKKLYDDYDKFKNEDENIKKLWAEFNEDQDKVKAIRDNAMWKQDEEEKKRMKDLLQTFFDRRRKAMAVSTKRAQAAAEYDRNLERMKSAFPELRQKKL